VIPAAGLAGRNFICAIRRTDSLFAAMEQPAYPLEVTVTEARDLLASGTRAPLIIDVREADELAINHIAGAEHIPMRQIPAHVATLARNRHLLVLCHHGHRSLRVTHFLRAQGFTAVSSIAGGIEAWAQEIDPTLARY
jgi:rhodanese-related sulfurtransferase